MIFMSAIVCGYFFLTELKTDVEKIQQVISLVFFWAFVVI